MLTSAPGTEPLLESVIVPVIRPSLPCANRLADGSSIPIVTMSPRRQTRDANIKLVEVAAIMIPSSRKQTPDARERYHLVLLGSSHLVRIFWMGTSIDTGFQA